MHDYIIIFFILIIILAIINFGLKKIKILVHSNSYDAHKKFGSNQVPLSGGLFFFGILYFLYYDQNIIDNFLLIVIISFLILGFSRRTSHQCQSRTTSWSSSMVDRSQLDD